ncbi:MAG: RNA polymerase sigma factor [Raoultibacter sp.]
MTEETHSDAFLQSAMETWGDTVYRLALNQTRSPVDADDVFQDVFLRLYNDTTKFESQTHLKAWLLRVTINRCLDVRRSGWKQRNTPLGEAQYRIPSPVADLYDSDVWEAVGNLPDELRAAIHLFYVEGYSTEELAEICGCNHSTMRSRLRRARVKLKSMLLPEETPIVGKEVPHE